jgi:hypothetical protein
MILQIIIIIKRLFNFTDQKKDGILKKEKEKIIV